MKNIKIGTIIRCLLVVVVIFGLYFWYTANMDPDKIFIYSIKYFLMMGFIAVATSYIIKKKLYVYYFRFYEVILDRIASIVGIFSEDSKSSYGSSGITIEQDGSYATRSSSGTTFVYDRTGKNTIIGQKIGDTTYYRDNSGKIIATCIDAGQGVYYVRDDCGRDIARGVQMGNSVCYYSNDGKKIGSETDLGGFIMFQ